LKNYLTEHKTKPENHPLPHAPLLSPPKSFLYYKAKTNIANNNNKDIINQNKKKLNNLATHTSKAI
jgi:hypothetical protein